MGACSAGPSINAVRWWAIAIGLAGFVGGLSVRTWVVPGLWYKYLGVALWCWIVYAIVVFLAARRRVAFAMAVSLVICLGMELAQITPVPGWLSRQHVVLRWIFGETFSPYDLLTEALAVVLVAGLDGIVRRWLPSRGAGSTL